MTLARVRAVVLVVFVGGIGGMIAGSIADSNAVAMTFGLVTAVAALMLVVATSVARGATVEFDEAAAARLEARIGDVVGAGADEAAVRDLVRDAVALGRGSRH
jgi:hypothetical protein